MKFDWDARKAATNRRKHGVSFEEASEVYGDAFALTSDDIAHSAFEDRERTVGRSSQGRVMVVISVRRASVARIISARRATGQEVQSYEKTIEERLRGGR